MSDDESSTARTIRLIKAEGFSAGYDRAIANLRDTPAYHAHQAATGVYDGGREFIADWLKSMKGNPHA